MLGWLVKCWGEEQERWERGRRVVDQVVFRLQEVVGRGENSWFSGGAREISWRGRK